MSPETFQENLDNALADKRPVCQYCGAKTATIYEDGRCFECKKIQLRKIQPFIDEQRAKIFGGKP